MTGSIIEVQISVSKIVFDPKVQPRPVNPEWVEDIILSIHQGLTIGPIRVGKRKDEWVCIEGHHRTTAYRKLGIEKIRAIVEPPDEEAWPGLAVKYNDRKGHAVTKKEREDRIRQMYQNGTKPEKIAESMGRSLRYVYNVLQPLIKEKQEEKDRREKKVLKLHADGLTQEKIAEKIGVSQQTVSYILRKHHIFSNPENLIISNSTKLCTSANFGKNYKIVGNAGQPAPESEREDRKGTLNQHPDPEEPIISNAKPDCTVTQTTRTDLDNVNPSQTESQSNTESREPLHYEAIKDFRLLHKYPSVIHELRLYDTPLKAFVIGRVLELIKRFKADLIDIQEDTGRPLAWLRKAITAAIAIAVKNYPEDQVYYKTRWAFRVNDDLVFDLITLWYRWVPASMFKPVGEGMDQWVQENLTPAEIQAIATYAGVGLDELPYLLRDETPPSKRPRLVSKSQIKRHVDFLRSTASELKTLRRNLENSRVADEDLDLLLDEFNNLQMQLNRFREALSKAQNGLLGVRRNGGARRGISE